MRVVVVFVLAAATACSPFGGGGAFHCDQDADCTGGPGAGRCELAVGFCSFADPSCASGQRYGSESGGYADVCVGDEPPIDARIDVPSDGPACVLGGLDLCSKTPSGSLAFTGNTTLDTDTDMRCSTLAQTGGSDACLLYANQITIESGAMVRVTGNRPLVLAATDTLSVGGVVDASSARGGLRGPNALDGAAGCAPMTVPENDTGGAAGGAGGSFHGKGGNGGTGDTDLSQGGDSAQPGLAANAFTSAPAFARGGCTGSTGGDESGGGAQGGNGGAPGGAVWLVAGRLIEVQGAGGIRANGAGGEGGQTQSGGGGGGSGGYIRLAATTLSVAGALSANGGSGGGGGCRCNGTDFSGSPGTDGALAPVSGGAGGSFGGGAGGGSSGNAKITGDNGVDSVVGGGGGGGGAGLIVLVGTATITGVVTPPAQ